MDSWQHADLQPIS